MEGVNQSGQIEVPAALKNVVLKVSGVPVARFATLEPCTIYVSLGRRLPVELPPIDLHWEER